MERRSRKALILCAGSTEAMCSPPIADDDDADTFTVLVAKVAKLTPAPGASSFAAAAASYAANDVASQVAV